MKALIVLALLGIIAALAGAGALMLRKDRGGDPRGARMARALAMRVALSVALFLFVLFGWWMGWIRPSGLPVGP